MHARHIRILIVEDDRDVREALADLLGRFGYDVDAFACGNDALAAVEEREYALAVVDVRLPDIDGLALIRTWQHGGRTFPTLIITALAETDTRAASLEAGARDYLAKPFSLTEIEERIDALLRHSPAVHPLQSIRVGNLEITPGDPRILIQGDPVFLSRQELTVLELLAERVGQVVRTAGIADHLARELEPVTEAAVATHVHHLRARLTDAGVRIRSLRGFGYLLETADGAEPD